MLPRHSWSLMLGAAAVAAALAGCSIGDGPAALREFRRPADGALLSEAGWEDAAANADQSGFEGRYWLLPGWLSGHRTASGPNGDSVSYARFHAFNLGLTVLPLLPLWFSNDLRIDRKSGGSATNSVVWTPLYTDWETTGWPAEEPAVHTWGFPLLYSRIDYGRIGEAPQLAWSSTLWTLGPSWMSVDLETHGGRASGWSFAPLMLAGFGPLLWISEDLRTPSGDIVAHGPLGGLLGYESSTDDVEHESSRKVLAGILWYDTEESYADGSVFDARHGPLWGMFGWGVSDGRPGLRVFWFPIDL